MDKTNRERLGIIETHIANMQEDITEIKQSCKEIPHMKTIIGFFSLIISAVVAGITSFLVRDH